MSIYLRHVTARKFPVSAKIVVKMSISPNNQFMFHFDEKLCYRLHMEILDDRIPFSMGDTIKKPSSLTFERK